MKKILVITGMTATGKTGLAIRVAKEIGADIISADSRQVYKGMDIGTGKDIAKSEFKRVIRLGEMNIGYHSVRGIRIWLLDIVDPNVKFSINNYLKAFDEAYRQIKKRSRSVIVAGGSGFYIESILNPKETFNLPPKKKLRWVLNKLPTNLIKSTYKLLRYKQFKRLNNSEKNNRHRLIRKIEICLSKQNKERSMVKGYEAKIICLTAKNVFIYKKIDKRVEDRLKKGLLREIDGLVKKYGWKAFGMNCLAYKEFFDYFEKKKDIQSCIERWKYDEHAYARRQKTWFKKKKYRMIDVEGVDIDRLTKRVVDGTIFHG